MDEKITVTKDDRIDSTTKAESQSTISINAVTRRRANVKMFQNVLLISLEKNIDESSSDYQYMISQLQCIIDDLITFTDDEECLEYVKTMNDTKVCMIIPSCLAQSSAPRMHMMSQVCSIFIFCNSIQSYEQWIKDWPKIKGIFTSITSLYEALKQVARQCEHNAISISIVSTSDDMTKTNFEQLDSSFIYTQILKEIVLTIKFETQHINDFIEYCRNQFSRTNNKAQLKSVTELEEKYRDKTPIWWYTNQCFLYPMLNSALRFMDLEYLIKMSFFIRDLHQHIEQLHKEQFGDHHSNDIFTVYRGQGLGKEELEKITKAKNGLLSFNNFLSTSYKLDVANMMAESNQNNPDLVGILFAITIDPSKSSTPFASIKHVSQFREEDEVLFSMHTVFRIGNITFIAENLFQVDLTLTDDSNKDLRLLMDRIRDETYTEETGWYRLGSLLLKMGESDQAEQVYETLLLQTTNDIENGRIYHRLGLVKYNQGKYREALRLYKKALEIRQQSLPSNHPDMANTYNNIGLVYKNVYDYVRALSSHEKALEIQQQSLSENHPHIASSYANIGNVYYNMHKYRKALPYHEKALAIKQQSLPSNHPDLGSSYSGIGNVYHHLGAYLKAISFHEKALQIQEQSLPPNHPALASSYNNIGNVYCDMGEYLKALSFCEKALAIRQHSLSPKHPHLASSYSNIGSIYEHMGEYLKARSFYERAIDYGERSLLSNHPTMQQRRKNLDRVRKKL